METSLANDVDGLIIIPYLLLIELDHHVQSLLGSTFIGVGEHIVDEGLEFLVDSMVLMLQVDLL
jgi:hypothetical protein